MKTICAWCGNLIKDGDESRGVSHGICKSCLVVIEDEMKLARKKRKEKKP